MSALQAVAQAVVLAHSKPPGHAPVELEVQLPAPLHVSEVSRPVLQAEPHAEPDHFAHTPPVQRPSVPQLDDASTWQMPLGSVVPSRTELQLPLACPVSAAEHAWHAPVQALLQQNPSTQFDELHWSKAEQATPWPSLASHWWLVLQK